MEIKQFIDELGGAREVGERIGLTTNAVYRWVYRGKIPRRCQNDIVRIYQDDAVERLLKEVSPL
jgi:predicted site-specific integrase-resolvase